MANGQLFINGQWTTGAGSSFNSIDPAYNRSIWSGHSATSEQVDQAVKAARKAFDEWSMVSLAQRIEIIEKFKDLLEINKQSFGELIAQETGKPVWESLTEVGAMVGKLTISIQAYHERTGEKSQEVAGATAILRHKPHGVIAVFGPYNFPGHIPNGHILPALLSGNTVIYKPSELTPMVAERTVEYWQQAGLPNGVINLVQGLRDTGEALSKHEGINGLFFTGSSKTGKILHQIFAGHPEKILALELGGNNPLIVHKVKDKKAAAYHTIQSAYITAGQRCTCARRLIVPKGLAGDEFIESLTGMVKGIQVSEYDQDPAPFMGSVISKEAANQVLAAQKTLIEKGANALIEMQLVKTNTGLLTPGLIDVTAVEDREDEEIFGPLLQIIRVDDFDAAIVEANDTAYGLSAGIFTDDEMLYKRYLERARVGILNWNKQTTGASSAAPFGGVGLSGNHRPSAYYAADYCAYPVASMESKYLTLPEQVSAGIVL